MCGRRIVTIDGPSGGGKSTVSRALAARLGFTYLDTGAMYRAVAYKCRREGVDPLDEARLAALLDSTRIDLLPPAEGGDDVRVLLDGEEVGALLRTPEMGLLASRVSARPLVRRRLTVLQQKIGEAGAVVAEGRDTGTVVFPRPLGNSTSTPAPRCAPAAGRRSCAARANRWMNSNCSPRSFGVIATTGNGPSRRWLPQRTPCVSIPPAFRPRRWSNSWSPASRPRPATADPR